MRYASEEAHWIQEEAHKLQQEAYKFAHNKPPRYVCVADSVCVVVGVDGPLLLVPPPEIDATAPAGLTPRNFNQSLQQTTHNHPRVVIPGEDEGEDEEEDEEPRPVMDIDETITRFSAYLQALHEAFDAVKIGDNPEISAEEVWEKFVELTEEHVMPLETDYAPAPVDDDGGWVGGWVGLVVGAGLGNGFGPLTGFNLVHVHACSLTTADEVFISMATYRDENCPNTLTEAFKYVRVAWWYGR
jgi:hypothetical protein